MNQFWKQKINYKKMSSKRVNFATKRIVTPKLFRVTWLWLIPSRMTSKLCNLSFVTSVITNLSMLTCWISIKLLVVVKRGVFRARNVTLFGILLWVSGKNNYLSIIFLEILFIIYWSKLTYQELKFLGRIATLVNDRSSMFHLIGI